MLTNGILLHARDISSQLQGTEHKNHSSAMRNFSFTDMKIKKELDKGHLGGPFESPPFENFIVSPIGLVPKKEPNSFRLIHDLSFPGKEGLNSCTPGDFTSVHYEDIHLLLQLVLKFGKGCLIAKADLEGAFRILPMSPSQYHLLGFKWNGKYYFDKRLPMGASIACSSFEQLSRALQWILIFVFHIVNVTHILDDFIFVGPKASHICGSSLTMFKKLAEMLNIPLNHNKTVYPTTVAVVHGYEVDTLKMEIRLPSDKVVKAIGMLKSMLGNKKTTRLVDMQSLLGFLNFACAVIQPGRPFLRRLINSTIGVVQSHHHVHITREMRLDMLLWLK